MLASIVVSGDQSAPNQADTFLINRVGTTGQIFRNGGATPVATWDVNTSNPVTVQGLGGDDLLTIDYAAGDPISPGGLFFDGGTGTDEMTRLDGPSAETISLSAGVVSIAGDSLSYANLESLRVFAGGGTDTLSAGGGDASVTAGAFSLNVVANGTVRLATGATVPTFSDVDIAGNGTLDINGISSSIDGLSGTGRALNNGGAATLAVGSANGSSTFNGTLGGGTGTLALTKNGSGTIVLGGNNAYTGVTNINAGALRVTHANALGTTGGNTNVSGGTASGILEIAGGITLAEPIQLYAKGIVGSVIPTCIANVSGANVISSTVTLNSGGTGYAFRSDSGLLRFTGALARVDGSTYHRPFQFRGAGNGQIDGPITTSTSWGHAIQKFDAGTWTIADNQTPGSIAVEGGALVTSRLVSGGTTTVTSGILRIAESGIANDPVTSASVPSVVIGGVPSAPNGTLDLSNQSLVIDYSGASPRATVEQLLFSGSAGGAWNGPGINSSSAAAAAATPDRTAIGVVEATDLFMSFPGQFAGQSIDSTSVLARYTLAGDGNLDGVVTIQDFSNLAANFGQAGKRWFLGDFNFSGTVDISDFSLLASNFGKTLANNYVEWQTIPQANFASISASQFTDDELRYVLPLYHFHRVANSVVQSGPTRGFIDISVWRDPVDNEPYNARVLENHVAFAFFYSQNRSWNPYFNNQQVRVRLEAIMDYWVSLQSPQGTWPEYSPTNYSLAPTSFGLRTMVRTLELLETPGAPTIDPAVKQRTLAATIKGLRAMLADSTLLNLGNDYSNQYTAVYGTALTFGRLYPQYQAELNGYLQLRVPEAAQKHQSPAGFMYEAGGPDWAYTLGTHQTQLTGGWHEIRGSQFQSTIVNETQEYYRWAGYNLIRQPDGSGYLSNYGATTRTAGRFFTVGYNDNPMTEFIPEARFLSQTAAEEAAALVSQRSSLQSQWGAWPALSVPSSNSYTPGPFIDIDRVGWRPTDAQRTASVNALPYLASTNFNHQAADSRRSQQYTFTRRARYYATFTSGVRITSMQRLGLGVLWNPSLGAVMQTQANSDSQAWGTRAAGATRVYEGDGLTGAAFTVNGSAYSPTPGSNPLANGNVTITYPLGSGGTKTVAYDDNGITITVNHIGNFTEELPLLRKSGENFVVSAGLVTFTRGGVTMTITHNGSSAVVNGTGTNVGGGLQVANLVISASNSLQYRITFSGP